MTATMISQFMLPALSFGESVPVIPGPLIAYVVNTTLTKGRRKAWLVVLAPLVANAPIIFLMTCLHNMVTHASPAKSKSSRIQSFASDPALTEG